METGVPRLTLLQSEHHHHLEPHQKNFYGTKFCFPYKTISRPAFLIHKMNDLMTSHIIKSVMITLNVFKKTFWTTYHKQVHYKMTFCKQFLML